jgi:type VI secretion system secreted protein VgrG
LIDSQGIKLTGNINILGNVSIESGSPESVSSLDNASNEGLALAEDCQKLDD